MHYSAYFNPFIGYGSLPIPTAAKEMILASDRALNINKDGPDKEEKVLSSISTLVVATERETVVGISAYLHMDRYRMAEVSEKSGYLLAREISWRELAYKYVDTRYRGAGVSRELSKVMQRIIAPCHCYATSLLDNFASINCLQSNGLKLRGTAFESRVSPGSWLGLLTN